MPLYEEKLINPLAVRFSQDRIWPDFQDGTRVEDSLFQIGSVTVKGAPYDLVLRPPFPAMEIIRLKQERRDADGEVMRGEKGRRLYGEESWFTFDNRRLYCLQRAALQLWPTRVAVVVKVLFDMPAVRCAWHKFRTTTDGHSVKISLPDGQPGSLWNWEEAARSVCTMREGASVILDAVRRDMSKSCKEMLAEVPPIAQLCPGTRETTVAERFNLGTSCIADNKDGNVAGQALLSMLQGSGGGRDGDNGGTGLAALLSGGAKLPPSPAPFWPGSVAEGYGGWQANSEGHGWGGGKGKGKGKGGGGRVSGGGSGGKGGGSCLASGYGQDKATGKGRQRQRKPKGGGKGEGEAQGS